MLPGMATSLSELMSGTTALAGVDSRSTPGFDDEKKDAREAMADVGDELSDPQERLWATARVTTRDRCCSCCRAWTRRARVE